ncbi:lytic murein transglycosylase [Nocardia sp. BSTN01]|uniref:lytic transglycosylase domain-containing protein n=1 Tax=Nocardia sp. BSTN01 TaxID=2783665 RepID=UPI00281500CE|nr:lytic murein transglycosylase [Nocardia sp. BSTN01]
MPDGSASSLPPVHGIPEIALAAYRNAELAMARTDPGCGVTWHLLAGIGRIESGHAGNGDTDAHGTTSTPIRGPALNGSLPGNEVIADGAGGWVRAVGPMQFLPRTWSAYAADGNGDGRADPDNIFDASLAAAEYLCSGGLNLRDRDQELRAVLRYNNSMDYARNVLSWSAAYSDGSSPDLPQSAPVEVAPAPGIESSPPPPTESPAPAPSAPAPGGLAPAAPAPDTPPAPPPPPSPPMILIPGLPPIPCGIFCPPPSPPVGH